MYEWVRSSAACLLCLFQCRCLSRVGAYRQVHLLAGTKQTPTSTDFLGFLHACIPDICPLFPYRKRQSLPLPSSVFSISHFDAGWEIPSAKRQPPPKPIRYTLLSPKNVPPVYASLSLAPSPFLHDNHYNSPHHHIRNHRRSPPPHIPYSADANRNIIHYPTRPRFSRKQSLSIRPSYPCVDRIGCCGV